MSIVDRVVVAALLVVGVAGCGGSGGSAGAATPGVAEGASSPERAVETFIDGVIESQRSKQAGEYTEADIAYDRMAAVFGTEDGSIRRSFSNEEVRNRMIVLAACFRPTSYRIITQPDPQAWTRKQTTVTVQLERSEGPLTLPFRCVLGRGERWFIEQIEMSQVSC